MSEGRAIESESLFVQLIFEALCTLGQGRAHSWADALPFCWIPEESCFIGAENIT